MSDNTRIEWTDATWNPMTGCTKVSAGCANCYATRMAHRLKAMGADKYRFGFKVECHMEELTRPCRWRKPRMVFVCSMGDLFHEDVPDAFIRDVFGIMRATPRHTYQLLTKRPERMQRFLCRNFSASAPDNVWLGTSVEDAMHLPRITPVVSVHAGVRFVSFEPLLGRIGHLPWSGLLGWVIVGGETGPGARPMEADWVRELRDQCVESGIPFFFKGWGSRRQPGLTGRLLDGREWNETPAKRALVESA
jgi:protein gp37